MKTGTVVLAATAALLAGASAAPPGLAAHGVGHCTAGEQVVFSCPVKGGKTVSLCATGALTEAGRAGVKLQYRFGRVGKPEMRYPAAPESPHGRFFLGTTMYSGGGEERIRFVSGGYDYVVFQRTIAGEWQDDGSRGHYQDEGVVVMKGGRIVGRQTCVGPTVNEGYPKMYDVLEREQTDPLDLPCCGEK